MGAHLIEGEFQSDKYPTTPRGKVPLSVKDPTAQDLLWCYAQRRRAVDAEFSADLEAALRTAGYWPNADGKPLRDMTDDELAEYTARELAQRAAEIVIRDPRGWRNLNPADLDRMAREIKRLSMLTPSPFVSYPRDPAVMERIDAVAIPVDFVDGLSARRVGDFLATAREKELAQMLRRVVDNLANPSIARPSLTIHDAEAVLATRAAAEGTVKS